MFQNLGRMLCEFYFPEEAGQIRAIVAAGRTEGGEEAAAQQVLGESFGPTRGAGLRAKQAGLVVAGIVALVLASNIRVPMWPVPVTMQTFAVLTIGAAYGTRLGLATLAGWLALGAAGVAVFSGENAGLAYFAGPTGGYLLTACLATGRWAGLAAADRLARGVPG